MVETAPHHWVMGSTIGVYVCDRPNDWVQVFSLDETFVKEKRIAKETLGDGAVGHCVLERRRPRTTKGPGKNKCPFLGVEAPVWQGARSE